LASFSLEGLQVVLERVPDEHGLAVDVLEERGPGVRDGGGDLG
jgi:hypothetical protein